MRTKKLDFEVNEGGCFIVTSHRLNKDGYGHFRHQGIEHRAHRFVYQECFGEIPDGLVVRHKCDNPSCINPEHLELGTPKENMHDAIQRKRNAYGVRNGSSTIDDKMARNIKSMLKEGEPTRKIMNELSVSLKTVRLIREGKSWKHVDL
ncbi:hypothetical protein GCM10010912_17860 [Paenibacillus albidus]|uniref:HNH nuclease domain-containing protein n=1 Tax=Paenibacillus albidus TaxID=2041023 RepID=A0A917C6Y9_9BACL|nr:HNH endonuclease signature motif containing protein [Paenibacillus albidus]GGF73087.1 hypothetical protein GCM10010912_17860 [Paenibacillus albidus]